MTDDSRSSSVPALQQERASKLTEMQSEKRIFRNAIEKKTQTQNPNPLHKGIFDHEMETVILNILQRLGRFTMDFFRILIDWYGNMEIQNDVEVKEKDAISIGHDPRFVQNSNGSYSFHRNTEDDAEMVGFQDRIVPIEDLIRVLQYLNGLFRISTAFQPKSRRGRRSTQDWFDQIKFKERLMELRYHRFRRDVERFGYFNPDLKLHLAENHVERLPESEFDHGEYHILQDYDQIQQEYLLSLEERKVVIQDLQITQHIPAANIDRMMELLDHYVKHYLHAPIKLEQYYRKINKELFQKYDDDPFQLFLTEEQKQYLQTDQPIRSSYPSLKVYSMDSIEKRSLRREQLLSSPLYSESGWNVECDRISGILGTITPS